MRTIDVARGPLVAVGLDTTLHHAAHLMNIHHVDAVVVTEDDRPVGIVTERDLVVRGLARKLPVDATVDAVMTRDPVTIDAEAPPAAAYALLSHRTLHRLPVTSDGRLVAIVTLDDFAVEPPAELTRLVHSTAEGVTVPLRGPRSAG